MTLLKPVSGKKVKSASSTVLHKTTSKNSMKLEAMASQHKMVDLEEEIELTSGSGSSGDDDESFNSSQSSNNHRIIATNRAEYGTWSRPLDFTLQLIGYVVGLHNFFRFPHMCYKYGFVTFFLPYVFLMVVVGLPIIFMECTIGQYYGVGSISAFRELAPIITGVSYILAWNSFLSCWIYGVALTWLRAYSGDSLSCLKGWVSCFSRHYYNTPYCFTGPLDDCCTQLEGKTSDFCPVGVHNQEAKKTKEQMYFNYGCVTMKEFCSYFGWEYAGNKMCVDSKGDKHSVYDRRMHATSEYFYGYVLGMRKLFVKWSFNFSSVLCPTVINPQTPEKNCSDFLMVRHNDDIRKRVFTDPTYNQQFWTPNAQHLQVDPDSSAYIELPPFAFTTVLVITFFLFDNLLSVSFVTYILSFFPFCVLGYLVLLATDFEYAGEGIEKFISLDTINNLWDNADVWAEALIQVLLTCGAGHGALISLSSFNKYHHMYLFDVCFVSFVNILTSILTTLLCFCTIGHYTKAHGIPNAWTTFIRTESEFSSMEFGYLVYSFFLTILDQMNFRGKDITVLLYFFMCSTFPTDTTIRLAQNVLDATVNVLPRLRYHSTMALLAVSFFYLLTLLPVMRNGGVTLFMEFEYFAFKFVVPSIILIEVLAVAWVYKAQRLMDNAETLGAVSGKYFRRFVEISLQYTFPIMCSILIIYNLFSLGSVRFRNIKNANTRWVTSLFGWLFSLTPTILFLLSVLKQLTELSRRAWGDLFLPLHPKYANRKGRRPHTIDLQDLARKSTSKVVPMPMPLKKKKVTTKSNLDGSDNTRRSQPKERKRPRKMVHMEEGEGEIKVHLEEILNIDSSRNASDAEVRGAQIPKRAQDEDNFSLGSSEIANWRSYIFWNEVMAHFEDWPDRLDESEVESEGSSIDETDDERTHI